MADGIYNLHPESATDKNIIITQGGTTLFKFSFDYLWGGAELLANGEETGLKVTGKIFRPGTRLVDAEGTDLVVVKTETDWLGPTGFSIEVRDPEVSDLLILATIYYHGYASAGKLRSLMMSVAGGGAS